MPKKRNQNTEEVYKKIGSSVDILKARCDLDKKDTESKVQEKKKSEEKKG